MTLDQAETASPPCVRHKRGRSAPGVADLVEEVMRTSISVACSLDEAVGEMSADEQAAVAAPPAAEGSYAQALTKGPATKFSLTTQATKCLQDSYTEWQLMLS